MLNPYIPVYTLGGRHSELLTDYYLYKHVNIYEYFTSNRLFKKNFELSIFMFVFLVL